MACKFSCELSYSKILEKKDVVFVFSVAEEEYKIKYEPNHNNDYVQDIQLSVEWAVPKNVLVTAELHSSSFETCFFSVGNTVNDKNIVLMLRDAFRFRNLSQNYSIFCVINIIPFLNPFILEHSVASNKMSKLVHVVHDKSCLKKLPKSEYNVEISNTDMSIKSSSETKFPSESSAISGGTDHNKNSSAKNMLNEFNTMPLGGELILDDKSKSEDLLKNISSHNIDKSSSYVSGKLSSYVTLNEVSTKVNLVEKEILQKTSNNENTSSSGVAKDGAEVDQTIVANQSRTSFGIYKKLPSSGVNIKDLNNFNLKPGISTADDKQCGDAEHDKIHDAAASSNKYENLNELFDTYLAVISKKHKLDVSEHLFNPVINNACEQNDYTMPPFFSEKTFLIVDELVQCLCTSNDALVTGNEGNIKVSNTHHKVTKSENSTVVNKNIFPVMEKDFSGLSLDMLDLLKSGEMVDLVLSNGNKEVKVHTAILNARVPSLTKLLPNMMTDSIANRITVDIPDDLLEDVILFFYSGLVNIKSMKMAYRLYKIAETYDIWVLQGICLKHMYRINAENVLDALVLVTDEYKNLKDYILNFFVKNFSTLKTNESMFDFIKENPKLILEIMSYALKSERKE